MRLDLSGETPIQAVLSGDLIGSSRADAARIDQTMALLSGDLPLGIGWTDHAACLRFTRYRGDGWQMLMASPAEALRWAVVLLAALRADARALETRIAIGFGHVDHAGSEDLSDAHGSAFRASGHALDTMHKDQRLLLMGSQTGVEGHGDAAAITGAERALGILIEERLSRWTPEQAEAVAHFLHPSKPSAAEIAARLGISPQAVGYRLRGAGAKALREALEAVESDWNRKWTRLI